jgi:hypothetical protein
VPIDAQSYITAEVSGLPVGDNNYAYAELGVDVTGTSLQGQIAAPVDHKYDTHGAGYNDGLHGIHNGGGLNSEYVDTTYMVAANTLIDVTMVATADASQSYNLGQYGPINLVTNMSDLSLSIAQVDPYFSIASGFANADLYQIVTSPGVGNEFAPPPGIPEPSTWAMMLLSFAGLGFVGYRRAKGALQRSPPSLTRRPPAR